MTGSRGLGIALVAVSASSFACLPIFARFAYADGGEPLGVLTGRFLLASAVMVAVMVVGRRPWPRGRDLVTLLLLGGVGYVGQSLSLFTALQYAPAGLVTLLLYLFPVIVTALAVAFLGERLTRRKTVALLLAIAGCALTIGPALGGRPLGIALGVTSALCYAIYITVSSAVTPRAGAVPSTTVILLACAGVYSVVAIVQRPAWPATGAGVAAIVGLALVSSVIAILAFFAGMERLGPTDASTLSTLEPVVTVVLAAVLLSERLAPLQLAGGALVLSAAALLARSRPESPRAPRPAREGARQPG